jgi:hypothetical protein
MKPRTRLFVALAALASAAFLLGGARAVVAPSGPTLDVNYNGAAPTVTLPNGTPVGTPSPPGTVIPAGTYTVDISVTSGSPDFQIVGPGVNFLDNEPTEEVFTITFAPSSTYVYEDVTNPSGTARSFSTTAAVAPGAAATPTQSSTTPQTNSDVVGSDLPAAARAVSLAATVSGENVASLSDGGTKVSRLKSGRYTLVVVDHSSSGGFVLQRSGRTPTVVSSAPFVGRRSITFELGVGTWFYYATPAHRSSFVVIAA